jgi:hypothetical protein
MRNHNVIVQSNEEFEQNNFLPTPLSKKDDDNPYYLPTTQDGRTIYSCKSNFDHQQLQKKKIECAAFENIHRVFVYTCKCNTSRVISAYLHVGTKVMLISLVDY